MSEEVATGILSGVVKVSGFFTGSIVNSKVGKKFFNLLPGEIVLASLDGFSKLFTLVMNVLYLVFSTRMQLPCLLSILSYICDAIICMLCACPKTS